MIQQDNWTIRQLKDYKQGQNGSNSCSYYKQELDKIGN